MGWGALGGGELWRAVWGGVGWSSVVWGGVGVYCNGGGVELTIWGCVSVFLCGNLGHSLLKLDAPTFYRKFRGPALDPGNFWYFLGASN